MLAYVGNASCKLSMSQNDALPVVNEVKDIGVVVIYTHLTFHFHIDKTVVRVFIRSNLIRNSFVSRDVATLMRAFTAYVRPTQYASRVWSPHQIGHIKQVEFVQRRFTKRLARTLMD